MKSKQSFFEQIISTSANKVMKRSVAGAKDEFQQRMKTLPSKIKQLNADPYMFIFDALISFNEEVDFTLTQYQNMMSENFLNMDKNSEMLVKHFRDNIGEHSFRIIQILMEIKEPNIAFMELFFQIHNTIPMPENVAQGLRYNGYRWMSKTYAFRQMDKPDYIGELTSGILKTQNRNLPTYEDEQRSRKVYIQKIVKHMTYTVQNDLKPENQKIKGKWGLCFMCLQPADYYCKDTKAPMCGSTCKKAHIAYISNNPAIDYIYSQQFREQVQKLLFLNLKKKKNMALSIDYLCSIYMNSDYVPKQALPHKQLLNSPVIVERIWVLYTMYHYRRKQVFEHIFADCLKSKTAYICISSAKYFLKIVQSSHIFEVYEYLDHYGYKRVIPIIINNLPEDQTKIKFISSLIDRIFDSSKSVNKTAAKQIQQQSSTQSSLLRSTNFDESPLKKFKEIYGQKQGLRQMMRFIIKNEQQVNKAKICQIVLQNNAHKTVFLQQLLLQNADQPQQKQVKTSVFLDEILRQIFYFINTKVADSIYSLFQRLCEVLDLTKLKQIPQWSQFQLQRVFGPDNVNFKEEKDRMNTFFQFAYLIIMLVTELNRQEAVLTSSGSVDKKSIKIDTEAQFLARVKTFDAKFATNQKQYIIATYNRLIQQSFQQKSRGVLTCYPIAKKQAPKLTTGPLLLPFSPVKILLDNWQLIYETISTNKNDSNMLYRICCCLTKFPAICRPFFQLLLNKLVDEPQAMKLKTSSVNIKKDENLIIFINNILQEQPNCIGITSWKYLFLRDPQPITSSHLYLFQISRLIHYSKSLTSDNFIYFVREFCRNVRISQNFQQCIDLLQYNFRIYSNTSVKPSLSLSQQRTRYQILNKQYIQLFTSELNHYYQTQFIKAVFEMKNYELAITLLDIIPVNIISQRLIVMAVVEVVQTGWKHIEAYGRHQKEKNKEKQKQRKGSVSMKKNLSIDQVSTNSKQIKQYQQQDKHNVVSQGQIINNNKQQSINKIWIHIIQKILTISLNSPQTLIQFSTLLHSIPELHPYFQILYIQYAIQSAFQGRQTVIHHTLTTQLHKFQQHIPQMHNTFSMMVQRQGRQGKNGLLQQFVKKQNIKQIVGVHFGYFWEIQSVYDLIVQIIVQKIKQIQNNHKVQHKLAHPNINELIDILKIIKDNGYLMLIRLQNRLQSITGFISATTLYLKYLLNNSTVISQQQKQQLTLLYQQYKNQLIQITKTIEQKLDAIIFIPKQIQKSSLLQKSNNNSNNNNNQQFSQQMSVKLLAKTYAYFTHIYNITFAYLWPIYTIVLGNNSVDQDNKKQNNSNNINNSNNNMGWIDIGPQYRIHQLCLSLRKINRNYPYRIAIKTQHQSISQLQSAINNSNESNSLSLHKFKHVPSLHQQSHMCWCISILSTASRHKKQIKQQQLQKSNNNNNLLLLYNADILYEYLSQFMPIYQQIYRNILNQKYIRMKVNMKQSLQSQSSNNTNNNNNNNNMAQINNINNSNNSNSNNNNDELIQFQLTNQQIKYIKQTIKTIYTQIQHRYNRYINHHHHIQKPAGHTHTHTQHKYIYRQLQCLLVQYIQLAFDFYQPQTKSIQFTQRQQTHHYMYQIYTVINQINNYYISNINNSNSN